MVMVNITTSHRSHMAAGDAPDMTQRDVAASGAACELHFCPSSRARIMVRDYRIDAPFLSTYAVDEWGKTCRKVPPLPMSLSVYDVLVPTMLHGLTVMDDL